MPKVSIIIPVYNAEKYLSECLDSVLAQTLRDIEITCVDDGSRDSSPKILEDYAAKDSRLTIISQANAGPGVARNKGLETARGDYILFVDSDDTVDPTLCEKTVALAEEKNADMVLYSISRSGVDFTPFEKIAKTIREQSAYDPEEHDFKTNRFFLNVLAGPWTRLWRSAYLRENELTFSAEHIFAEDMIFLWKALMPNPRLAIAPEILYRYRHNTDSLMANGSRDYGRKVLTTFDHLHTVLRSNNKYHGQWKEVYLFLKLLCFFVRCSISSKECRRQMLPKAIAAIGDDEREYLKRSSDLRWYMKEWYRGINDSGVFGMKSGIISLLYRGRSKLSRWLSFTKR